MIGAGAVAPACCQEQIFRLLFGFQGTVPTLKSSKIQFHFLTATQKAIALSNIGLDRQQLDRAQDAAYKSYSREVH